MGPGRDRVYEHGERIEFPDVITNIGSYYNSNLNEFKCPVSGMYMFTTSTMSSNGLIGLTSIMLDGTLTVATYADGSNDGLHDQFGHSTNFVIVECDEGQRVWVQCFSICELYDDLFRYATFSGILLHTI